MTDPATELSGLKSVTVTVLLAMTLPARMPCEEVIVRFAAVDGMVVRVRLPVETRA